LRNSFQYLSEKVVFLVPNLGILIFSIRRDEEKLIVEGKKRGKCSLTFKLLFPKKELGMRELG